MDRGIQAVNRYCPEAAQHENMGCTDSTTDGLPRLSVVSESTDRSVPVTVYDSRDPDLEKIDCPVDCPGLQSRRTVLFGRVVLPFSRKQCGMIYKTKTDG